MERVRARLIVQGSVQGVGYRFFVTKHARHFEVTGMVRNLPGNELEVVAEGERKEVENFLERVQEGPPGACVTEARVFWEPWTGFYPDFRVEY